MTAKRQAVQRSDAIIAISHTTRKLVLEHFEVDPERVIAVPLGISGWWHPPTECVAKAHDDQPFLLYVGERRGYKNWRFVLECLADVSSLADFRLVCVGKDFNSEERAVLEELGLQQRVSIVSWPSDASLRAWYWSASALVFPSREEGFGLPTIEALACGCSVVLSDIEVFRETADGVAAFFKLDDPSSFAHACVQAIMQRDDLTEQLRRVEHAQAYSIERMVRATAEVYQRVLAGSW